MLGQSSALESNVELQTDTKNTSLEADKGIIIKYITFLGIKVQDSRNVFSHEWMHFHNKPQLKKTNTIYFYFSQ